jgi:hypothetical protein
VKKQTKAEKQRDTRIERAYYRTCSGVQIPMMAIPGIFRAVVKNMEVRVLFTGVELTDAELDVLVKATVDSVRVN